MRPFPAYGRWFSVARVYNRLVRQRPQLLTDTVQESRMVAARQIGPANAAPEEYVSPDEKPLLFTVKAYTTRRMPGKEENGQVIVANSHGLARGKEDKFAPVVFKGHAPPKAGFRRQGQDRQFFFVEMEG